MTTLAALAAAGLIAGLPAAPDAPASPPGAERAGDREGQPHRVPQQEDVRIEGDVTYQPGTGRLLVENGAVLRRGAVTIRARSATYDPASGEVRATGGVLLTDPTRVIKADAIRAVLEGEWEAEGVVAFVKDQPVDLGSAETIEAARRDGRNRLSFSGAHLRGESGGPFRLDGARLTLCDCPGDCAPSWEVTARKADVIPGKRAILSWPVLRITPRFLFVKRPVPVLALPWLYVPLGDRQTGLLLPELRRTDTAGFALALPLFVTLGRSADATLTADHAFGRDRADVAQGKPAIRGPGARLELRWAPAVGAEGFLELVWLHDLDREPGGEGGDRFAFTGRHVQRLSERTSLVAGLRLAGDPVWVREVDADYQLTYRRSEVLLSHRRESLVLEAGASYLQPLRPDGNVSGWGRLGADERVASRWPGAFVSLLPVGVGPLQVSARTSAARYAPVADVYDRVGRPAAVRGDVHADLSLPLLLGGAVTFAPYLRGTATGHGLEGASGSRASGWGVAGAALATEVSRRFGGVRHVVAPRLEWRSGTTLEGDPLPWIAYDVHDRTEAGSLSAGPAGAWDQLRAAVATRLTRGAVDLFRLEIGQDLDLRRGRFGESFSSASAALGPLGVEASARFLAFDGRGDPSEPVPRISSTFLDRFTELGANARLAHGRASIHAGFFAVGPGGSGRLTAGIDPLFDLRAAPFDASAAATAGAQVVLGPATLGYDVSFHGRAAFVPSCPGVPGERRVDAWQAQRHVANLAWDSPCRCFRVAVALSLNDCADSIRDLGFKASIDLSRLGAAKPSP